jgi:peptidoglycan/LPS O-acetylase OafA/YrhL
MNVPAVFDRTSSGKEHFEVLDGLRGSAAFLIVIFHLFNYSFGFQGPWALVKHAHLAVDFFFALSGFVVAYAYDDRRRRMTIMQFFRIRLIRLHPLVLVGATLGLLFYLLEFFSIAATKRGPLSMVLLAYLTSLLLLPSPPIVGRHNESQALNGPAWSLMQEYLGNIAYALILRRLRTVTLWIVFTISGLALIWVANSKGSLDGGWDYPNIWMAPLRLTVSFVMGLLLYRIHDSVRMPKIGLLILSIILVVCFQMPHFVKIGALDWNGLYEAACVLALFPVIILCGAHSNAGTGMIRLCKFSGRLSYPLYITHIGFVYILASYAWTQHPGTAVIIFWILVELPIVIFVAWLFLKFFDEPVRAWLTRRHVIKPTTVPPEQLGAAR